MISKKYRYGDFPIVKKPVLSAAMLLPLFMIMILLFHACGPEPEKTLVVYSGKGLRVPVKELITRFERKHPGIRIETVYAGSMILLRTIRRTQMGDVFISGDRQTIERGKKFIEYFRPVAYHIPVVAVAERSRVTISSFEDLARKGVRLAVGNTKMCVIGRVADAIIAGSKTGRAIGANVVMRAPDPVELIAVLREGDADAAIIWKDMFNWPMAEGLAEVEIPRGISHPEEVDAAVLRTSTQKADARLFVDFLCSSEAGGVFRKNGFGVVDMR